MTKRKRNNGSVVCTIIANLFCIVYKIAKKEKKTVYNVEIIESIPVRQIGFYEKYVKRCLDIICSLLVIICFSWLYVVIAVLVRIKLGSPIIFVQERPGLIDSKSGKETVFKMFKFRTMTDARDEDGKLLPDEIRLTKFGAWLRSTSLDELPEVFNILNGTMTIIGPRPQLVKDMVFMTVEQRMRHTAKPGLSGLAQVNGRNAISWEDKLEWDLRYISHISMWRDLKILFQTVEKAFVKREGITGEGMATAEDLGDYLLKNGKISFDEYSEKQNIAEDILARKSLEDVVEKKKLEIENPKYSVLMSLYRKEKPEYFKLALESVINQTATPDEIVLVVDGSLTDELYAVIDLYKEKLHLVINKTNLGLGLALNNGLKECRNEFVARMDTDDISKPDRCEKQLKRFAEKPYLAIVGSHIDEFVGDTSNIVSQRKVPTTSQEIYEFAKRRSAFNHPTVMYRKSKVLEQGGYGNLRRNQDVDLFGRMLFAGNKAENIDESLLWFRSSDELARRRKSWENTWSYIATIKKFWKMGYSSFTDLVMVTVAQTGMYIMPIKFQNYIYKRYLRRNKDK